jgi:hypothetical protein
VPLELPPVIPVPPARPVPPVIPRQVEDVPLMRPVVPETTEEILPVPPVIPIQPGSVAPVPPSVSAQQAEIPQVAVQPAAMPMVSPFQGLSMEMQQAMFNHFMAMQTMQASTLPAVLPLTQPSALAIQPNLPVVPPVAPQVAPPPITVQPTPQAVVPQMSVSPGIMPVIEQTVQPPSLTIPTTNVQRNSPWSFMTRTGHPTHAGLSQQIVNTGTTAANQQASNGTSTDVSAGGSSSGLLEEGEEREKA